MFMVLDRDNELYLFASPTEAVGSLETIDIENCEYEFCDACGQRFSAEVTSPVTAFRSGAFLLRPQGLPDPQLPLTFVVRARHLSKGIQGIRTLEQLGAHFERAKA
jgi:hypothetical protein